MKVLHLTRSSLADAPIRLNHFLNKTGLESRCIQFQSGDLKVETDILWNKQENLEQLQELLDWTDIVHIHNQPPLKGDSKGWNLLKECDKPFIYQVHGEPEKVVRQMYNVVKQWVDIKKILCIAQYHAVYLPKYIDREFTIVRNIIDIDDPILQPKDTNNVPWMVTYSPSNKSPLQRIRKKRKSTWAYKSFYEVEPILRKLKTDSIIDYTIYYKVPWRESLEGRQKADMHIDDIYTGSYHLSSLEGLSQGKIVFNHLAEWMRELLTEFLGCERFDIPIVDVKKKHLKNNIIELVNDKDCTNIIKKQSRQFMEKHWSNKKVFNDYYNVYKELI